MLTSKSAPALPAIRSRAKGLVALLGVPWLLACSGQEGAETAVGDGDPMVAAVVAVLDSDPLAGPQATSLFGEALYAQPDTAGVLSAVDAALREDPNDVERLIDAARARRNLWQYRQAMALYTRAGDLAPDDWRPFRYRGHRHLSVREFATGARDLERARELAPYNWDVAYHLGLAYFLDGRFDDAATEYMRCLDLADDEGAQAAASDTFRSCSENATDLESRVAMLEWATRALLRAGRDEEAEELLGGVEEGWPIEENLAYYHDLLYHKGLLQEDQLMSEVEQGTYRLETVGYGIVNQTLVQGDTARAVEILETLVEDPWWPGFGRLAAEAELARLHEAQP